MVSFGLSFIINPKSFSEVNDIRNVISETFWPREIRNISFFNVQTFARQVLISERFFRIPEKLFGYVMMFYVSFMMSAKHLPTQSLKFLLSISFRFAQFTHSALPRSTMDFRLPRKTHHHRWRRPLFQVIGSCKDRSSKFVLEVPKSMQTYIFTVNLGFQRIAFCIL